MKYYSISNLFLVAVCVELNYIATLTDGVIKSGSSFEQESLLANLCADIGDQIQVSVFESLIHTASNSTEAEELFTYFKVKENAHNS
jgi:hypothetical protein